MHGIDSSVPLFHTHVQGTRIVVTPQLVADVLHVLRVEHPDYLGCDRLRTVSKDKMIFTFYERPFDWGDRQFTPYKAFSKGLTWCKLTITPIKRALAESRHELILGHSP